MLAHAAKLGKGESDTAYPSWADNGARRALVDFFAPAEGLAIEVDKVVMETKPDSWVGNPMKEKKVRNAVMHVLGLDYKDLHDREIVDRLVELLKVRHEYR